MKIVPLEPALEPIFWEHVNQDLLHYYFFAFNWKYNRAAIKILLVLEETRIVGMLLLYKQYIVQLRGSCEAAKALLEHLDFASIELQALEQHKQHILAKYKQTTSHEMILMVLHAGEEQSQGTHPVVLLGVSDAEKIAAIMRIAHPDVWSTATEQTVVAGMRNSTWYGINVAGELVSVGNVRMTEWTGHIGVIAIREDHRNRGYATSVVSKLIRHDFEKHSRVILFSLREDLPAQRVYSKIGFKPYRKYYFMQGNKL